MLVLFHSIFGLRPGFLDFAQRIESLGIEVFTPDVFAGAVFDTTAAAEAHRDDIGTEVILHRMQRAIADIPPEAALGGVSFGAFAAQKCAYDRPQARGVVLLHHVAPPHPQKKWPGQPVQAHRFADDPWTKNRHVSALVTAVQQSGAVFADFVRPGRGHIFTDLTLPDGNAQAADITARRIAKFMRPPASFLGQEERLSGATP